MAFDQSSQAVPNIFSNEMFLKAAFGAAWDRVKVVAFPGDPDDQPRGSWVAHPALVKLKEPHSDQNTYFSVSVQSGANRTLADFEAIHVIVIDDVGTKVDRDDAEVLLGTKPSYLLETSSGNFQAGWFVEPILDRAWALGMTQALHARLRSDNLKNAVGLMRLPIGTNHKPKCGPAGFKHCLREWRPDIRLTSMDWIEIEKRVGQVTPIVVNLGAVPGMPDPAEAEADAVLQGFRLLGRVQNRGRQTTMGWGYDVDCPWMNEHSDRTHEGAVYVPVLQRFHCHHGHCQDRKTGDVRTRLDELLRRSSGGVVILASLDFEEVEVPRSAVRRTGPVAGTAIDLWDEKIPPAWPGGVLPAVIEDTLFELSRQDEVDLGALGATMMTASSGAADKRAILQPYATTLWQVRPVLWHMHVAIPGLRKTEILRHPLEVLRKRNKENMDLYKSAMGLWKARGPADKAVPAPKPFGLLADDTTPEWLQEMMSGNPRGLFYFKDELAALFDFGRYSTGAGTAARAFFLETYEGGPKTVGRMTRQTTIDNCALAILGCIQPDKLTGFKDLTDDGLLSRFGITLPQLVQGGGGRQGRPPDVSPIHATIKRLLLNGAFDVYRTNAEGEALIRKTEAFGKIQQNQPGIGTGFRGFLLKLHGMHARTAMVLHLMDGGVEPVIPVDTVERAGRYVKYLHGHADVFYDGATDATAQTIGSYLLRHPSLKRVTTGQLRRDVRALRPLKTDKEIHDALFVLVVNNWLKPETRFPNNKSWFVNPALQDQFAARAASERDRVDGIQWAIADSVTANRADRACTRARERNIN